MAAIRVIQTREFQRWILALKDSRAKARITDRLVRLAEGNTGHAKSVGAGIVELKIDFGPGYRVYYTRRGMELIFLLCGGDKSSQHKDIRKTINLAEQLPRE